MNTIATDKKYLVVGLGKTGVSCVRYLVSRGSSVEVIDSRKNPPNLQTFKEEFPDLRLHLGLDSYDLNEADVLVMSPGVPLATPEIQKALSSGVQVTSDIELFLTQFSGKVVAITGSNAKSTVTAWLGEALKLGGHNVLVAGNIGNPVLDSAGKDFDVAVLELSSFQLELLPNVGADVATILNISEDHMDRYESMAQYVQSKQKIYFGCKTAIFNRDDSLTQPLVPDSVPLVTFGQNSPDLNQYGLSESEGEEYLTVGFEPLLEAKTIGLPGRHNVVNALSVLAIADAVGNERRATFNALQSFRGLKYRCEFVGSASGVDFINDSKATNVGSVIAALNGLVDPKRANIVLLLGGRSKGQDLTPLKPAIHQCCKKVITFGEDRSQLNSILEDAESVETLSSAFKLAVDRADVGDVVLLSPACASFDQFPNFEARGEAFNQLVEGLM